MINLQVNKQAFTANVSRTIDPVVLAGIQKSLQEKADRHCNNDSIECKFIAAAAQSKIDVERYILMNEYAQTLTKLGVEYGNNFKKFLEKHNDIIEFKPNAPYNAPAIRVKGYTFKREDFLEQTFNQADKVYIDTCALMEVSIETFFEVANPILKKCKKKIAISAAVVSELRKNARILDPEKQNKAEKALKVIYSDKNETEISSDLDDNESFADSELQIIFMKNRTRYKMLLITRDSSLACDILRLNKNKSVHGKRCMAYWIDNRGDISKFT
jgi:rRNA-processing protein FCF1